MQVSLEVDADSQARAPGLYERTGFAVDQSSVTQVKPLCSAMRRLQLSDRDRAEAADTEPQVASGVPAGSKTWPT